MTFAGAAFLRVNDSLFIAQNGRTIQVDGQWSSAGERVEQFIFADGTYAASAVESKADLPDFQMFYINGRPVICTEGFATPVVFDLDNDGVELIDRGSSHVKLDTNYDGRPETVGWVASDDALLVLDRNSNGEFDGFNEISFLADFAGAGSDLEGLYAYDTNGDGFLTSGDNGFGSFFVWQDANGNGRSDPHEMQRLSQAGISAINLEKLTITPLNTEADENQVVATSNFMWDDGTVGSIGDVALYAGECGCGHDDGSQAMFEALYGGGLRNFIPHEFLL